MGGRNATDCSECPEGSYSESDGTTVCINCPAGSASNVRRATSSDTCVKCPAGAVSSAGSATCTACPTGSYPDSTASSCLVGTYTCPSGYVPAPSITVPTSFASCVPLSCLPPLLITNGATACAGCGVNTSGEFPNCTACADSALCPGVTSAPLLSFASAAGISAKFTSACPTLTGATRLTPVLPDKSTPLSAIGYPGFTGYLTTDNTIIIGIFVSLFVLLLLAVSQIVPALAAIADPYLKRADLFAKMYTGASPRAPLHSKTRRIGGACTLLGGIAFVTLALVNILQRAADNISIQKSIVVFDDAAASASKRLPVFSSEPWGTGVQVRITASGDGTECARPLWSPLNAGWTLKTTTGCGGSGASQLVFSCADCITADATMVLDVTLHYSCQSLLIEAGAIDALGVVTSFAIPAEKTAAASGTFVSSVVWTLPTLLSVVNSTVSQYTTARGYTIISGPNAVATNVLSVASDGNSLEIVPNTAAVSIKIAFPLNTFYSATLLSEKQPLAALLSSLVGLAGIFSLFGSLLAVTDFSAACLRKNAIFAKFVPGKRSHAFARSPSRSEREAPEVQWHANPLAAASPAARAEDVVWHERKDENAKWYESSTGQISWALPDGATLASSSPPPSPRDETDETDETRAGKREAPEVRGHANPLATASPAARAEDVVWHERKDENAKWYESSTGQISWALPDGATLASSSPPPSPRDETDETDETDDEADIIVWFEKREEGVRWYESSIGQISWTRPEGAQIAVE